MIQEIPGAVACFNCNNKPKHDVLMILPVGDSPLMLSVFLDCGCSRRSVQCVPQQLAASIPDLVKKWNGYIDAMKRSALAAHKAARPKIRA